MRTLIVGGQEIKGLTNSSGPTPDVPLPEEDEVGGFMLSKEGTEDPINRVSMIPGALIRNDVNGVEFVVTRTVPMLDGGRAVYLRLHEAA